MSQLVLVAGLVLIVEGAPWFLSPPTMRTFLTQLAELPDPALRVSGLLSMVIGLLLIYSVTC